MIKYYLIIDSQGNCYYAAGNMSVNGSVLASHYRLKSYIFNGETIEVKRNGVIRGGWFDASSKIQELNTNPFN